VSNYFQGKRVLITGASSGIGAALSRKLAHQGANLTLVARNVEALSGLKNSIEVTGAKINIVPLDISDCQAVTEAMSSIPETPVDILINNAGIACCDRFENLGYDDFDAMMKTNFLGQVSMIRAVLPTMKSEGAGHIVNIASMAGLLSIAGYTAYGASKSALIGFNDCLRNELAGSPIRLTLVLSSDVDTPQYYQESKTRPAANAALSGSIKLLSSEEAANRILYGVQKYKKELVVSPLSGRIMLAMARRFPSIGKAVMDQIAKKYN